MGRAQVGSSPDPSQAQDDRVAVDLPPCAAPFILKDEMSRPAVFFDRDNTLIVNSEYLGDPDQVELIPNAAEAVGRARALGFAIVVVSNQSGVARGMFGEDDVRKVNARMDAMLVELDARAIVDRHEFCPTHPQGKVKAYCLDDDRRKPKPGMILDAARGMGLDLKRSWLIGDAPRDVAAGHAAGCRTILLRETFRSASPATSERATVEADYVASSLLDAVDFIEMNLAARPAAVVEKGSPMDPATFADDAREPQSSTADDAILDVPTTRTATAAPTTTTTSADASSSAASSSAASANASSSTAARPSPAATRTPAEVAAAEQTSAVQIASAFAAAPRVHVGTQPHVDAPPRPQTPFVDRRTAPPASPIAEPAGRNDRETAILLERVVDELRRANDPPQDFSIARMLAGITQGFALAVFVAAIIFRDGPSSAPILGAAIFLQLLVSSLLLMGR